MEKSVRPTTRRKMHQTTVRFGADLWGALQVEAKRLGVSVAQYVRDAALGRLSYDAGRRDEQTGTRAPRAQAAENGAAAAQSELSQSEALWAQGRLARQRAADLRAHTEGSRAKRRHLKT
jgi:hypothetical protein